MSSTEEQVFIFLLRLAGLFQDILSATTMGASLCLASVYVFVVALRLANRDRISEQRAERAESEMVNPTVAPTVGGDEKEGRAEEATPAMHAGTDDVDAEEPSQRGGGVVETTRKSWDEEGDSSCMTSCIEL